MKRGFLLRQLAAVSVAVVAVGFSSPPVAAAGNAGLHLHKTVDPTQLTINPNIGVTLAVDKTSAIPADTLTYTAVVTNPTVTFAMGGDINAEAIADADATVAYYWDELELCALDCGNGMGNPNWTAVATFEATQSGYQPVTPPKVHTGMSFAAQPVTRPGVVYPTGGDPILGTAISPAATAGWTYLARITLAPAQIATLSDPSQALAVRNVLHMEVTIRNASAAQPYTDPELFTNPFTSVPNPGAIANVTVTFTLPDGTTTKVPATPSLPPGGSATAKATYKVPVPAARGAGETEAAYIARLHSLDGSALTATAVAAGSGFSGTVYATSSPVTTNEFVPIVVVAKSGPSSIVAGDTETNPLALQNVGGAAASSLAITDTVPSSPNGSVSGTPASLAPNATGTATATYPVPVSQAEGSLTDTASVTWKDANGNSYGPLSSSFTTTVHNVLFGAELSLAPVTAGPNPTGSTQTLTATLIDRHTNPIPNQVVTFTITGANPGTGTATTDASGKAVFTYTGNNAGNDTAIATVVAPFITLTSNTASISWGKPLQPVVTTQVQGNFFPNPNNSCEFSASGTPVFSQSFPDILFNADPSVIPHDISSINPMTRPFTDKTVDVNGNYNGQIVAQGNGFQAGATNTPLFNFFAVFTGSFIVNQAGDVTFTIIHDDGYILGVGNGATRVNGDLEGNLPATTAFNGYGVVAGFNLMGSKTGSATVHFPAPGTYPYEIDYTECAGNGLQLVLETAKFIAQTDPLSIYVGYADGLRAGGSIFPFPWQGSPGVTFIGGCTFDAGAIRFDNSGNTDITLDHVTVDLGSGGPHFDLWPANLVVPAHGILILTQTGCFNFDTSDFSNAGCGGNNGVLPLVNVTRGGVLKTFTDTGQVLNTHGFDSVCQGNESIPWQRIAGQANTVNVPLPPAVMLDLMPFNIPNAVQGQTVSVTVSALDSAGNPQVNLPVTLQVFGVNAQNLTASTNTSGLAAFSYPGNFAGSDTLQASAFISGQRAISNQGTVVWTPPGGNTNNPLGATITNPSPADGTLVTRPVAVDATISPPAGHTITAWRVFYQAAGGGPKVLIGGAAGAPPSPLGVTFDPTLLADGVYTLTFEATSDNGVVQDVASGVSVIGAMKLGRYTTTYQDISVPVNGFQMEVRRTYDSTDQSNGDFGVGWRVSVSNFRVASNRNLGAGGWSQFNKSCVLGLCFTAFKNSAPRYVTVIYPDQHSEIFDFVPDGGTNVFWSCSPVFKARTSIGGTSTLVPLDDISCSYQGDGNLYGSNGLYNPQRFRLTTHSGLVLVLDRSLGLVSMTDRNGNQLNIDSTGVHSSNGQSITFSRDGSNRISTITGPTGQALHYAYSPAGDLASSMTANSVLTTYTYDVNHHLLKSTGPNGPIQTQQYDPNGRLVAIIDGGGNSVQVRSDVGLKQETFIDPNLRLTTIDTYDDLGDLVRIDRVADGTTLTATMTYDGAGHLQSVTDPAGATLSDLYDSAGNMTSLTDRAGNTFHYGYDAFGNVTSITGPGGAPMATITYDPSGNLATFSDGAGNKTTFLYDSAGHVTNRVEPDGRTVSYTYDTNGNLATATSAAGTVNFSIDASGRLAFASDANGHKTTLVYDADGNLRSQTDAGGHVRSWTYDGLDRMQTATNASGGQSMLTYDAAGRLQSIKDANGTTVQRTYDADGHLTSATAPDGSSAVFAYDGFGRMTSADSPAATLKFTYDSDGHMGSQTSGGAQPANTLTYTYDADGRRASAAGPDGTIDYSYDPFSDLASVTDANHGAFKYTYDAALHLTSLQRPDGVTDTNTYDAAGHLLSRTSSNSSTTLASEAYTYSAAGQRTSLADLTNTATYKYDPASQLLSVANSSASLPGESYAYDAAGNRVSAVGGVVAAYDTGGRLVQYGAATYTYDADGERTSSTSAAGVTTYTWNAFHQLTGITLPGNVAVHYGYDALGRRVEVDQGSSAIHYVYDGENVRLQYAGTTLAAAYTNPPTTGAPLEVRQGGASYYFLTDALDSTVALADQSGAVVNTQRYAAFGNPLNSTGSVANTFTYLGQQYDSSTGLYYLHARYYDSQTGGFLSPDPLPSVNPYTYAVNDPVDLSDPAGATTPEYVIRLETDVVQINETTAPQTELVVQSTVQRTFATIATSPANPIADAAGDWGIAFELLMKLLIVQAALPPGLGMAVGIVLAAALFFVVALFYICSLLADAVPDPSAPPAGSRLASGARVSKPGPSAVTLCSGQPQGSP